MIMALAKVFRNGTAVPIIRYKILKEGDRAIDTAEVLFLKNAVLAANDKVEILQDTVDTENLVALYNFNDHVKDESGFALDGTATSLTYADGTWQGRAAVFDGSASFVSIPDNDKLDFDGEFEINIWFRFTSSANAVLMSKSSSSTTGFEISVNDTTTGDIKFRLGSTSIISSYDGYNDGVNHFLRITRDSDDLITMYVNDVNNGTATDATDITDTETLYIGKNSGGNFFAGGIQKLRIYKGGILTTTEASALFTARNSRTNLKFGGYITKVDSDIGSHKAVCQSYGKALGEIEIRGEEYNSQTVEYIIEDLITNNTNFTFISRGSSGAITLTKFLADGKLIDIIRDLSALIGKTFYTDSLQQFVLEFIRYTETDIAFTHGVAAIAQETSYDDTELVNDLTVLGEVLKYETVENFSGNSSDTEFTTAEKPILTLVKISGVVKTPEQDYEVDGVGRKITFTTPPATGTNNIEVTYTYEKPLFIQGSKPSSITQYGEHAKRLIMPWIKTRADGVRFVQSYLQRYKDVNLNIKVFVPKLFNAVQENDVIRVVNSIKNIDSSFQVKSIEWKYPEFYTEIKVGEYNFDAFDYDRQITAKIHDLESFLTVNKELRDYESPEEILAMTDTVLMDIHEALAETLSTTDSITVIEKDVAVYSQGSYGSGYTGDIYGS